MIHARIVELAQAIVPLDQRETVDKQQALDWLQSTTNIFRVQKPDVPSPHLVAYFVLFDAAADKIFLVEHLRAGKWLPTGGHVELNEYPVDTVRRESREELGIDAAIADDTKPIFITITPVHDHGITHTDISLWFVVPATEAQNLNWDRAEFKNVQWWPIRDIMNSPIQNFDPELHRFCSKLQQGLGQI